MASTKTAITVTRHVLEPNHDVLEIHEGPPITEVSEFMDAKTIAYAIDPTEAVAFGVSVLRTLPEGERVFCLISSRNDGTILVSHTGDIMDRAIVEELLSERNYATVGVYEDD